MRKLLVTVSMLVCVPLMAQVLQPLGYGLPARVVASYASGNNYVTLFEQKNLSGGDNTFTVARWNGTYWSYYTGGLNIPTDVKNVNGTYNYHSVVLYKDTMYVGAYITNATGEAANNVNHLYKWNGSIWQPVLKSISSKTDGILAMTVFKDKLIVAGRFQNSLGGGTVQNIVAYDGEKWEFLSEDGSSIQGTNGTINSLVTAGNRLYIGGQFQYFNGDYTGNIVFYTSANGNWGGFGSPYTGTKARILELASYNGSIAALGLNETGTKEIRIFNNGTWTAPLNFDTFDIAEPTTIAGAGGYLLIGGKFEKAGNGTSLLRYESGQLAFTGTRITGDFSLGQRGSEAFVWGAFTEQNTGIKNISKIETSYGDVVGSLYFDKNQNCIKDLGELNMARIQLRFEDEGDRFWFAMTDSNGHFAIALPEGNYAIQAMTGRHWVNYCPSNYAVNVRKGLYSSVSLGSFIPAAINDAEVKLFPITPAVVKAGDPVRLQLKIHNSGSTVLNGPTIQFKHDSRLTGFMSEPAADNYNVTTGEATYTLVNAGIDEERIVEITMNIPAGATASDNYRNYVATGSLFTPSDAYAADNQDTADLKLINNMEGSVVKTSDLGGIINYRVTTIGYKVKFTNISSSTVNRVVLLDTLDKNIIIKKVVVNERSPADAQVRLENGILIVEYPNANLTAFESDPSKSSGFVNYDLVLKYQLKHNDHVYNTATADFDSKWKGTSKVVDVLMYDPNSINVNRLKGNISKVYPNPANSMVTIDFNDIQTGMLDVLDPSGKVIITQKLNTNSANVDVRMLANGIYFLRCPNGTAVLTINR